MTAPRAASERDYGHDRHVGLAAVLFDMDGTLLDSEQLWGAAMSALARQLGGELSEPARLAMVGRNGRDTMKIFYEDLGVTAPDRAADRTFLAERMAELYASDLTWRPGAAELVAEVRAAGIPIALVTSTHRGLVEVAMDSLLGRDTFDTVVCGNEVAAPKPDPESYLTAADRLQVPITRCVAIEDSPTGMASALAAGARVLGVRGEVELTRQDGAELAESLTEVDLDFLVQLTRTA